MLRSSTSAAADLTRYTEPTRPLKLSIPRRN
jgi:hypothetical protein